MIATFMQQLGNNLQHDDASVMFDVLQESLGKYFETVYAQVRHRRAVVLGIESILQNPQLEEERSFLTALSRRGLSALESYCIEAHHFFNMTVGGHGNHSYKPLWRLEGDALRRWGPARRTAYTVHEAFWLVFLHRYVGTADNNIEQLLFESIKQTHAEEMTAQKQIKPDESLERFCARALRNVYKDVEQHDFQNQMRFLIDEVFILLD